MASFPHKTLLGVVDGAIEVLQDALDLDVGFIHASAATHRTLVFSGHLLDERQKTNRPPVDRQMADRHAAFFHDLLEAPVVQRVGCIPVDADQDHIDRKSRPLKLSISNHPGFGTAVYPTGPLAFPNATELAV
jgi:hypothetical protein